MANVTIHIDETFGSARLEGLRDRLLGEAGVLAAASHKETPHLIIVEYDPAKKNTGNILKADTTQGVHAELIGL